MAFCAEEDELVSLSNQLTGEDMGGFWQETSTIPSNNNAFNAANGTFSIANQASGTYTFVYKIGNINSACPTDESTVTIVLEEVPTADAGLNQSLTCQITSVNLDGSASTGDSYEWTDALGNSLGTTPNIAVTTAGVYTLTVITAAGCTAADQVQVSSAAPPIEATIQVIEPDCVSPTGDILLSNISGGTPNFSYRINGGDFSNTSQFNNLEAGTYDLQIQDAEGCLWDTSIIILEAIVPTIDLGLDQNLFAGDSVMITIRTNVPSQNITTLQWSNDAIVSCETICLTPTLLPTETTTITATLTDINGCTATDELLLFVDKTPHIYAPTGFTPNGDTENDFFMIFTGKGVKTFQSLQIFSRWGEMVFEKHNLSINEESEGWDGTFKSDVVNPDVFVWTALFELSDGRMQIVTGDVTVIR